MKKKTIFFTCLVAFFIFVVLIISEPIGYNPFLLSLAFLFVFSMLYLFLTTNTSGIQNKLPNKIKALLSAVFTLIECAAFFFCGWVFHHKFALNIDTDSRVMQISILVILSVNVIRRSYKNYLRTDITQPLAADLVNSAAEGHVICVRKVDMNLRLQNILFLVLGILGTCLAFLLFSNQALLAVLEDINSRFANSIVALFTVVLVFVTLVYVVLTYFQVKASNASITISQQFLNQAEKDLELSKIPILAVEIKETLGSPYLPNRRRQLGVNCTISNIGDGAAVNVYTRMSLAYKYVECEWEDQVGEYSFIGNIGAGTKKRAHMHFETSKIERMIEDFSIEHAKNIYRLKNDPSRTAYRGPDISIEVIYSNVHGKSFKSHLIHPILSIDKNNGDKNSNESDFRFKGDNLPDNEKFELIFMNPIFQEFSFSSLTNNEANELIEKYRTLYC